MASSLPVRGVIAASWCMGSVGGRSAPSNQHDGLGNILSTRKLIERCRTHHSATARARSRAGPIERDRLRAMRILAVETATLAGSAALLEDGQVIGATSLEIPVTHSERLMAMVDRLLHECARDIEKMDALAVSIGPGSFTGLRVGIATVKGLALTLGFPVAPVPTLDPLASNLPFADATVCPLLAAL